MDSNAHPPAPPSWWATFAGTVVGNLYLVLGTLLFAVLSILVALVPPRGRHVHRVARVWARGVLAFSFVRLEVEGLPGAGAEGRFVYLANHQSLFDIPALLAAIPERVLFLAKASLFRIPIFGWAIRLGGFVPVDRGDKRRARESFGQALGRIGEGASVLIFPEETRTLDGRLLPFRKGGMLLAAKSGLPAVPVGVEGTLQIQSRHSFLIRPRTVRIRFGEPVVLAGESVRRLPELTAALRARVAELARAELADG
ncbi:MAG TPA: lysophospholipid acyltransferase family protein [Thermoanaerobaculia bacterium]|nr:lysophospholipid acyltransferase family protein [Thermoanaerobaculia bacterium]